jgi:SAM-dependent methyltransferase
MPASPPEDSISGHYDGDYFAQQRRNGEFGAKANRHFFQPVIKDTDAVIDFGCGGGFYLDAISCREKLGVEVNPVARRVAQQKFPVVGDLSEIPNGWADVVMSSHALEHTYDPFEKVKQVSRTLKAGGTAVFVVPCERYDTKYVENNYDQHLYTWSPANLGNLFSHAGFTVESCEFMAHWWPPKYELVQRLFGWRMFQIASRIYGRVNPRLSQVRIVARKPTP